VAAQQSHRHPPRQAIDRVIRHDLHAIVMESDYLTGYLRPFARYEFNAITDRRGIAKTGDVDNQASNASDTTDQSPIGHRSNSAAGGINSLFETNMFF
jgi:hypothetical protein